MLNLENMQRIESVAPDWTTDSHIGAPEWDHVNHIHRVNMSFINRGFGPAFELIVGFESTNKN